MFSRVQAFKDGDVRFLICTDVAARGIDIQGLPYVVNMTLPDRCILASSGAANCGVPSASQLSYNAQWLAETAA